MSGRMSSLNGEVNLSTHRTGLPGKETVGFLWRPLLSFARRGLRVAIPFRSDRIRTGSVIMAILLSAGIPMNIGCQKQEQQG